MGLCSENKQQHFVSFPPFFNRDTLCICCAVLEEASASFRAYVRSSSTHMKLSAGFVICSHHSLKLVLELQALVPLVSPDVISKLAELW